MNSSNETMLIDAIKCSLDNTMYNGKLNEELSHLAVVHGIAPLLAHYVTDTTDTLKKISFITKVTNESMKLELAKVCRELNKIGIEPIILKGFSFLEKYPSSSARAFSDVDLQLEENQIALAHNCLIKLGYKVKIGGEFIDPDNALNDNKDFYHLAPYVSKKLKIEVHRPFDLLKEISIQAMIESAVTLDLDDSCTAKQFNEIDNFIYSCIHYIRHGYDLKGIFPHSLRISHIIDACIMLKYTLKKGHNWGSIYKRSKEVNCVKWVYHVLLRIKSFIPDLIPDDILKIFSYHNEKNFLGHEPNWKYRGFNITFFERLLNPEKALEKIIAYMEESSLVVNCYSMDGTEKGDLPLNKFEINERQINVNHPCYTHICEVEDMKEIRSLTGKVIRDNKFLYINGFINTSGDCESPFDEVTVIFAPNNLKVLKPNAMVPPEQVIGRFSPLENSNICQSNLKEAKASWYKIGQGIFELNITIPLKLIRKVIYDNVVRFDVMIKSNDLGNILIWNGKPTYGKMIFK